MDQLPRNPGAWPVILSVERKGKPWSLTALLEDESSSTYSRLMWQPVVPTNTFRERHLARRHSRLQVLFVNVISMTSVSRGPPSGMGFVRLLAIRERSLVQIMQLYQTPEIELEKTSWPAPRLQTPRGEQRSLPEQVSLFIAQLSHLNLTLNLNSPGKGIGRGIALKLAEDGLNIAINDIQSMADTASGTLEEIKKITESKGARASLHIADVTNETQVIEMIEGVVKEHGSLDVVSCNIYV